MKKFDLDRTTRYTPTDSGSSEIVLMIFETKNPRCPPARFGKPCRHHKSIRWYHKSIHWYHKSTVYCRHTFPKRFWVRTSVLLDHGQLLMGRTRLPVTHSRRFRLSKTMCRFLKHFPKNTGVLSQKRSGKPCRRYHSKLYRSAQQSHPLHRREHHPCVCVSTLKFECKK